MMNKRIIFAGTPEFAKEHLQALLDANIVPVAVYTQPDRKSGRGHKLTPSPVKELALLHNIKVYTPENFKNEQDVNDFLALNADIAIVVAYGVILPEIILNAPKLGCINIHGSLLPEYRGAAPIQRALFDGKIETGISIMKIVKELDAGAVYCTAKLPILDTDTSASLFEKLARLGAKTLIEKLKDILDGTLKAVPQDETLVTYAKKLTKEEAFIDFNNTSKELSLKVRTYNPWPVAYTSLDKVNYKIFKIKEEPNKHGKIGEIIEINKEGIVVGCKDAAVIIEIIQAPGKGQVKACDFARSKPDIFKVGTILGTL